MSEDIKTQRDRFLAFAFASADLFIEISIEGKIVFALGATKTLTGKDEKSIMGRSWLELFAVHEQARMQSFYENCKTGKRSGPVLVNLNEMLGDRQAILTAFKLPGNRNFFVTFATGNALMSKIARMTIDAREAKPLGVDDFSQAAQEQIKQARAIGQDVGLTLFDFAPSADQKSKMGEDAWQKLQSSVGELLAGSAFDGQTAGQMGEGRITLIHEKDLSADDLRAQIQSLAKRIDPAGEGYDIKAKTVDVDVKSMSDRDASRALLYTLHEFERQGTEITIKSLQQSLETQIAANAQRIKELQTIIERTQFNLHFQPIIDLKTREATHYEMLCRFESGNTADWISFCEDVGLAPQFDLAICDRAVQYIKFKGGTTRHKFSVNLSGQSIADAPFCEKLKSLLEKNKTLAERMMFEITESAHIKDLDKVGRFIKDLQHLGFKVALDDFGAGAASFQYLQKLEVDFVKIDGKYTRKLLSSERDMAMIKNLVQMCKDLNVKTIAECVESQAEADVLKAMGVDYAQGYLYGKAEPHPSYTGGGKAI